jgi:hypothetical protein
MQTGSKESGLGPTDHTIRHMKAADGSRRRVIQCVKGVQKRLPAWPCRPKHSLVRR